MMESEQQIIKLLEEIRDNLVKQEQEARQRMTQFVQDNEKLNAANAKQYEESNRTYRQSLEKQQQALLKPNVVAMVLLGIIALCLVTDLILRCLGK